MRAFIVLLACLGGCVETSTVVCSGDRICPAGSICDDVHHGCTTRELMAACAPLADGATCTIDLPDDGVCDASVCIPARCGDGYRLGGEACDGSAFGDINNCQQLGYYDNVPLACSAGCELDRSVCTGYCGDGKVTAPQELCDGALPAVSCVDLGYVAGQLQCSQNCGPDFGACVPFGWHRITMPQTPWGAQALSSTNVWVVGANGMVRHFDGVDWSDVDASGCTTGGIKSVVAFSATDAFLLLEDGVGLLTSAGCTKYSSSEPINAIWASSTTDLYAAADTGLWHLVNGTWTQIDAVASRFVWGSSAMDVWVTGTDPNDTSVPDTMRHYDGQSWSSPAQIGSATSLYGIWGTSTDVYVAGADSSTGPVVMHNGGSGWSNVLGTNALMTSFTLAAIGTVSGARNYVLTLDFSTNTPYVLSTRAGAWANTSAPTDIGLLTGTGTGALYATTNSIGNVTGPKYIYYLDGAALATAPKAGSVRLIDIAPLDENNAVAVALPPGIFASPELWRWDGATWSQDQTSSYVGVYANDTDVYALFGLGVHKLIGPGQWSASLVSAPASNQLAASSDTDIHFGYATDWYHWNGSGSPTLQPTLPFVGLDIWAGSPTLAFIVGADGRIARWNGSSWNEMASPVTDTLGKVWGRSATEVYAMTTDKVILFDGVSWSVLTSKPATAQAGGIWGTGPKDLFISSLTGVFHWDGVGWTPVGVTAYSSDTVAGVRDTLFVDAADHASQLLRLRPW